ncbi:hypothetical protein GCM10009858_09310 [Terrabacter carboxydivorans]|uniref:DUF2254 domain-containing protein n=2 Tax=Terrabacter carboxydivorans TaxID=619730 RepID=A0ABN3L0H0_9MICO
MINAAKEFKLSNSEWLRFCDVAELNQRTFQEPIRRTPTISISRRARVQRAMAGAIIAFSPIAVVALAQWLSWSQPKLFENLDVSGVPLDGAIALAALIATINVFTVQLSTTRLPSTVARVAGQPRALLGSYASALTLLGVTAYQPKPRPTIWTVAELLLTGASLAWLAVALVWIFRRTDPAEACKVYVERNLHKWARAGREWGAIQWRAIQLERGLAALPFVETGASELIGHDVARFVAPTRGVLLPSRRLTKAVLRDATFAEGSRLHITSAMGIVVASGVPLAFLRPAGNRALPRGIQKKVRALLAPLPAEPYEDVSTQTISLAALALRSAADGDTRLGEAIAEQSGRVLAIFLAGAQGQRDRYRHRFSSSNPDRASRGGDVFPVAPALRDLFTLLSTTHTAAPGASGVADVLLKLSLNASAAEDQAPTILLGVLAEVDRDAAAADRLCDWYRLAGICALEQRNAMTFQLILDKLERLTNEARVRLAAVRALVALAAASVRLDPEQVEKVWGVIRQIADQDPKAFAREVLQVGAVSLDGGAFPTSLSCAQWFHARTLVATLEERTGLDNVFAESAFAKLNSVRLGDSPTGALEAFRDFTRVVCI